MRKWGLEQEAELFETIWQNLDPISHRSRASCPIDGSSLRTQVMPHYGPERFYLWACCPHPDCRRILTKTAIGDPRAEQLRGREWSPAEQADMVRIALANETIQRCPIDGVPIRVARFRDEDEAIVVAIRCYRCDNEFERPTGVRS